MNVAVKREPNNLFGLTKSFLFSSEHNRVELTNPTKLKANSIKEFSGLFLEKLK